MLATDGTGSLNAALIERFVARGDQVLITDLRVIYDGPSGSSYMRLDITSMRTGPRL